MATHAPRLTRARRAELLHGIYVILNDGTRLIELADAVLDAGVHIVQYRAKGGIIAENVRQLRELTRDYDALLIVNDDWRVAADLDCDGVHLGPDDADFVQLAPVRATLGERLIGLSCGTIEEARLADAAGVDYLGVGSIYATQSKADAGEPIGIRGLRQVASATPLPVAAIGGITTASLPEVRRCGVAMAALVSAISEAGDAYKTARDLVALWNGDAR